MSRERREPRDEIYGDPSDPEADLHHEIRPPNINEPHDLDAEIAEIGADPSPGPIYEPPRILFDEPHATSQPLPLPYDARDSSPPALLKDGSFAAPLLEQKYPVSERIHWALQLVARANARLDSLESVASFRESSNGHTKIVSWQHILRLQARYVLKKYGLDAATLARGPPPKIALLETSSFYGQQQHEYRFFDLYPLSILSGVSKGGKAKGPGTV